jgi:hypothetical protein
MTQVPPFTPGQIVTGSLFNEPMRVETVQANGPASWAVGLVGTQSERFRKVTLTAEDLAGLTALDPRHSFDGDGRLLRLGLQAYALGIAYEFDPYFGLSISRVDPLPHQLEAVYDYLLKLARVRFLLADDAGAFASLERALAIYATGRGGERPVRDKKALVAELRQAVADAAAYCKAHGVDLARIEGTSVEKFERAQAVEDAANCLLAPEAVKRDFLSPAR